LCASDMIQRLFGCRVQGLDLDGSSLGELEVGNVGRLAGGDFDVALPSVEPAGSLDPEVELAGLKRLQFEAAIDIGFYGCLILAIPVKLLVVNHPPVAILGEAVLNQHVDARGRGAVG